MKNKFQGSSNVIKGLCGSFIDGHPIIFHWSNLKSGGLNVMELFDQRGHLSWCYPREFGPRFTYDSTLSSFLNSLGHTFDLHWGDESSLAYLACTNPLWLPIPSSSGLKYSYYFAYRVLRQFGFDQDIPLVSKEVVPSLPSLNLFLRLQAFSYQSQKSSQFVVPNSHQIVFGFNRFSGYWRRIQKSFSDYVVQVQLEGPLTLSFPLLQLTTNA